MDNLENWEIMRMFAYIILVIGVVFYLTGAYFDVRMIGLNEPNRSTVVLIVGIMKDIGTVCGSIGGIFALFSGD